MPFGILWSTLTVRQAFPYRFGQLAAWQKARNSFERREGWGHINLTGDYVWNAQQTTDLENLRGLADSSQST
jgi:hypothetical protein